MGKENDSRATDEDLHKLFAGASLESDSVDVNEAIFDRPKLPEKLTDADLVESAEMSQTVYVNDMTVVCSVIMDLLTAMNGFTRETLPKGENWQGDLATRYRNVAHNAVEGGKMLSNLAELAKKKEAMYLEHGAGPSLAEGSDSPRSDSST